MRHFPYAVQQSVLLAMWQAVPRRPGQARPYLLSDCGDFTQWIHYPPMQILNRSEFAVGNGFGEATGAHLPDFLRLRRL